MYHRPFKVIVGTFIMLSLLAVVGVSLVGVSMARSRHPSDEWWQGYMTGRLESGEGEGSVLPYFFSDRRHASVAPLACSAGLLILGLPLVLLVLGGLFFRRRTWKAAGKPCGPGGAWHWHKPSEEEIARMKAWHKAHGPIPPWCREWEEPAEEGAEKPADDEPR